MKILLPVDGTNESRIAAKKAAEIAKANCFPIKFISIISPGELRAYKRYTRMWQQVDGSAILRHAQLIEGELSEAKLWRRAFCIIQSIIDELDCPECQIESQVLVGKTSDSIFEIAEHDKIGLIVMSGKYLKKNHFVAGLFAKQAVLKSPCPVLIVNAEM